MINFLFYKEFQEFQKSICMYNSVCIILKKCSLQKFTADKNNIGNIL